MKAYKIDLKDYPEQLKESLNILIFEKAKKMGYEYDYGYSSLDNYMLLIYNCWEMTSLGNCKLSTVFKEGNESIDITPEEFLHLPVEIGGEIVFNSNQIYVHKNTGKKVICFRNYWDDIFAGTVISKGDDRGTFLGAEKKSDYKLPELNINLKQAIIKEEI